MKSRLNKLRKILKSARLDSLLVSSSANIAYLTGYPGRDSYFLVAPKKCLYFTDPRYTEEARLALKGSARMVKTEGQGFKAVKEACQKLGLKSIGFETGLSYGRYLKLKKSLGRKISLRPTQNMVEGLRKTKDPHEIEKLKKALRITALALRSVRRFLRPGKKEREIAAELERFIRYHGGQGAAFDIIVASGPNSAFPHHISGERKLRKRDIVLIDLGVDYRGYKCDLTRVFFLGKMEALARQIRAIVLEAQRVAIQKIKPGEEIAGIDAASRRYITRQGFGERFNHNLGHGVGLEVHEEPRLSSGAKGRLEPGMVFTVEPGVYLPGKFGIRIEDVVLVTRKGCEVLSGAIH
ncbi:MAG: aminopeptidase P family protein [Candidatus Omnitrophica bacterium]|nr:aminopeptidase P family protein [Candidatus Omnitrophota bacterium]